MKGVIHIARNLRIKAARAEKDMTQKELADAVNSSRQTINAIEQGEYNPTIRLCRSICRVLGKSLDDLFGEKNEPDYENTQNPSPDTICFLTEVDAVWGGMLEDVLKQNGIPTLCKSTMGAGLAAKAGSMLERIRFYVRYEHLPRAKEIVEELFPSSVPQGKAEEL